MNTNMNRRRFLQLASASALPIYLRSTVLSPIVGSPLASAIDADSDKVLVLVQLMGGNDGLSTLTPIDQFANLAAVRSNILVPEASLLKLRDDLGFHPVMQGMKDLWDDARLHILQDVGYPDQNRSHFRSQDIWNSGSAADVFESTGWLGRNFERDHPDYPFGYPNAEQPHPFALTIGNVVSETCQGTLSNYSLALEDPFNPGSVAAGRGSAPLDSCYGRELSFVREVARQTNAYADSIRDAANAGDNRSDKYPDENVLAQHLRMVARLIAGGLRTKVYIVRLGGFDTHGYQVPDETDATVGIHADLLRTLSDALCAFQDDLARLGVEQRVLGMTYSEFGRRIRSNASFGTDHGTAAPLFLFGSAVCPGVVGDNPVIARDVDIDAGVPMQHDFRDVYATVLADWFEVDEALVADLLFKDFRRLPIFCNIESPAETPTPRSTTGASPTAASASPTPPPMDTPTAPTNQIYMPRLFQE